MRFPKYKTMRELLDAHARGEAPKKCRVISWSGDGSVTIETQGGVVLYRAKCEIDFAHDFAASLGFEGVTA